MAKRNSLTKILILVIAISLGAAAYYYQAAKQQNPGPASPGVTAPGERDTPGESIQPATGNGTINNRDPEAPAGGASTSNPLQVQIEQKYTQKLQSVGGSYEGRLNGLIATAISDYQAAKNADPNADITPLVNKYYAEGQALQAECDAKVYAILDEFENELRANSLPTDAALNARATYEAAKSERARQLLSGKP